MEINISNSAGRDAIVSLNSVRDARKVRWVDHTGRPASTVRVLKEPVTHSADQLLKEHGDLKEVGAKLIEGDPEVDLEMTGMMLSETSRVFIDPDSSIARRVSLWDIVRNPDGSERDRRNHVVHEANVAGETPLKWSGVFIKKADVIRKFVLAGKQQLIHVNGLTYDFLFSMAEELQAKKSMLLLGAGPKANQPLVLRRGGTPYRGLLEGRTQGDRYSLLLHFTNQELKLPAPTEESE